MKLAAAIVVLPLALFAAGCPSLGVDPATEYEYRDPATGEMITTTVGDHLADQIEGTGSLAGSVIGKVAGVATGNPIVGVSAASLIAALFGAGASRLRRKKKQPSTETGSVPAPSGD